MVAGTPRHCKSAGGVEERIIARRIVSVLSGGVISFVVSLCDGAGGVNYKLTGGFYHGSDADVQNMHPYCIAFLDGLRRVVNGMFGVDADGAIDFGYCIVAIGIDCLRIVTCIVTPGGRPGFHASTHIFVCLLELWVRQLFVMTN